MTRTMYDTIGGSSTTNPSYVRNNLWHPGDLMGYYIAGNSFIWTDAQKALFPASALVSITLTAGFIDADVLDVETGGATPGQTHDWIAAKKAKGYLRPTIYCSRSTVPSVRTGTGSFILGTDYDLWVAEYNGDPASAYPGSIAHQYNAFSRYDISSVFDDLWPHRKAPVTTPITQDHWNWCNKCQGLFYGPNIAQSNCPAGGTHDNTGSGNYSLNDTPGAP